MKSILVIFISLLASSVTFAQNSNLSPASESGSSSTFGRNIISISPMQLLVIKHLDSQDNTDVGVNFAYERISKNEYFGFKLPVTFSLKSPYYYFMPALKIYPFGQGPVKFSFGPQFYVGTGQYDYDYNSYDYPYTTDIHIRKDRTQVGFLINTSINFTIMQSFYLGLEAGLGINYYESYLRPVFSDMNVCCVWIVV